MHILPEVEKISTELTNIFKDLHQHPELGFEEVRTSRIVKEILEDFGDDTEPSAKRARSSYTLIVGPKVSEV